VYTILFFHRFGIEAITLEGHDKEGQGISSVFKVGKYGI